MDKGEIVQPELEPAGEELGEAQNPMGNLPLATAPLSVEMMMQEGEQPISPPQFVVGIGHSVGLQREHNEDAIFAISTNMITDSRSMPFGIFVVADGMGGHQHGEIASGLAVRAVSSYLVRKLFLPSARSIDAGDAARECDGSSSLDLERRCRRWNNAYGCRNHGRTAHCGACGR
jgi:hypothetical protein